MIAFFLLNGDYRGQAPHIIDFSFFQLADPAFGKIRNGIEKSPLTLAIDHIKRQRGFAGPGHSGNDSQLITRNLD
ncbi:hypothetical protein D3C80_2117940 [compost metagenome]